MGTAGGAETNAKSLVLGVTAAAGIGLALSLTVWDVTHGNSPPVSVAFFCLFLIWASNPSLIWADVSVTSDLMVVMAAAAAFHGRSGVLPPLLVGLSGGLLWHVIRNPARSHRDNLLMTAFNCGQFALSASAAAVVYNLLDDGSIGHILLAAGCASLIYGAVNAGLVLAMVVSGGEPARTVWTGMVTALPNFFSLGLVGVLVGELYGVLGLWSLVFLIVPSVVGRRIYHSTLELRAAHEAAIRVFMRAMEVKDPYTARHTARVARYTCYIGEQLGFRRRRLTHLRHAALMHDIGKLAVNSRLLNKPGRLTPVEYAEIQRHNEVCVEILSQVQFLRSTIPVASDQHGKFVGADRRNPQALEGYIVSVADAFDAMTSTRAYRKALPQEVAFAELRQARGTQFHPDCVDALIHAIERRGETFGAGHEHDLVEFAVEPPVAGVGSAGLGDLEAITQPHAQGPHADGSYVDGSSSGEGSYVGGSQVGGSRAGASYVEGSYVEGSGTR
jgi:hypothetical protein